MAPAPAVDAPLWAMCVVDDEETAAAAAAAAAVSAAVVDGPDTVTVDCDVVADDDGRSGARRDGDSLLEVVAVLADKSVRCFGTGLGDAMRTPADADAVDDDVLKIGSYAEFEAAAVDEPMGMLVTEPPKLPTTDVEAAEAAAAAAADFDEDDDGAGTTDELTTLTRFTVDVDDVDTTLVGVSPPCIKRLILP